MSKILSKPQTEAHFRRRDIQYQVFIGRLNEENLPCHEKRNQFNIYKNEDSLQARLYRSLLRCRNTRNISTETC